MAVFNHYIINAVGSTERRQSIIETFRRQGLEPRFFTAIMGKELSIEERRKYDGSYGLLDPGELGCALSHLSIYQELLDSSEPYMYIFEDDIQLIDGFTKIFDGIHTFLMGHKKPCIIRLFPYPEVHRICFSIDSDVSILEELSGTRTCGYIINRAAAANILQVQSPVKFEIDSFYTYRKLGLLKIYSLSKAMVTLFEKNSRISTIGEQGQRAAHLTNKEKATLKDKAIREIYHSFSGSQKMRVHWLRLQYHWQKLMWHK